ncbi:MAG TPA: lantibiotic dehydratase, partial [Thermoleophilia bacterium]
EPAALAAWARDRGLPRRLFVRSPLERKPIYVDLESEVLLRVLARFLKPVAERAPEAPIFFTEMLPDPDECWLRDANGRYTSELRVVAVRDRIGT